STIENVRLLLALTRTSRNHSKLQILSASSHASHPNSQFNENRESRIVFSYVTQRRWDQLRGVLKHRLANRRFSYRRFTRLSRYSLSLLTENLRPKVAENFFGRPSAFLCSTLHQPLEINRAMLAREVTVT